MIGELMGEMIGRAMRERVKGFLADWGIALLAGGLFIAGMIVAGSHAG
jgi:hypothetical protein